MKRTTQSDMQAVALDQFGGPEALKLQTLPVPEVGPDEVLVRVESAGVGVWDPFEREGGYAEMLGIEPQFPYVLGSEGAGVVAAVGEERNVDGVVRQRRATSRSHPSRIGGNQAWSTTTPSRSSCSRR